MLHVEIFSPHSGHLSLSVAARSYSQTLQLGDSNKILNRRLQRGHWLFPWSNDNESPHLGHMASMNMVPVVTNMLTLNACVMNTPRTDVPPRIDDAIASRKRK
jgi:hypothetical protein